MSILYKAIDVKCCPFCCAAELKHLGNGSFHCFLCNKDFSVVRARKVKREHMKKFDDENFGELKCDQG